MQLLQVLALCSFVYSSEATSGATYYVSPSGSDSATGTFTSPWKTVQKAATSTLVAGDTVILRGGSYVERVSITNKNGSSTAPITFTSYTGETVKIEQTGVTPTSGTRSILTITNSNYIVIKGIEFQNHKTSSTSVDVCGIYINGACNGVQIRNNLIHDIWQSNATGGNGHGIAAYGDSATAINGLVIYGNEIHHCLLGSSETVALNGNVTNFTVTNNLIHDCNNIGIDFIGYEGTNSNASLDRARSGVCSGNTIYNIDSAYNPAYGGTLGFTTAYGGLGNTPGGNGTRGAAGIYSDGGSTIIIERNLVYHCNFGIEVGSEHNLKYSNGITVRDNILRQNHVGGLVLGGAGSGGGTTGSSFSNNTLYLNDTTGYGGGQISVQDKVTTTTIKNNILVCNASTKQFILVTGTGNTFTANAINWNLYSGSGTTGIEFIWNNNISYSSFSAWKSASSQDANSFFTASSNTQIFTNVIGNDFTLFSTSPAVNAGDSSFAAGTTEKDYGGQSRIASARVDMGADEYMTAWQAWRDTYFTLPDGGTNANAADDPDRDGMKNVLEYALNANPLVASNALLPTSGVSGNHPTLRFSRNLAATDLTLTVETSGNMSSWTGIATKAGTNAWTTTTGVTLSEAVPGVVTVSDSTIISPGGKRFLRLKVLQP